jgi:hypothetical protein
MIPSPLSFYALIQRFEELSSMIHWEAPLFTTP